MAVAIGLLPWYSFFALMIADSVKHLVHMSISAWLLWRGLGGYAGQRIISTTVRSSIAAAGMGVVTFGADTLLEAVVPGGTAGHAITVLAAGGVGVITFSLLASWLKLDEWRWILDILRRALYNRGGI
jgi:hypothetical protein